MFHEIRLYIKDGKYKSFLYKTNGDWYAFDVPEFVGKLDSGDKMNTTKSSMRTFYLKRTEDVSGVSGILKYITLPSHLENTLEPRATYRQYVRIGHPS